MIDVDCPNCGYHLGSLAVKPLQMQSVKEATYPQDLDGKGLPGPLGYATFQRALSGPRGQLRLVSQKSRGEKSHEADVKEIKRLYREGYSLARIRHTLRISIRGSSDLSMG